MRTRGLRGRWAALCLASWAAALVAASAFAASAFAPFQSYPTGGGSPQAVAVADVTGDKRADVLLADPSRLLVYRGGTANLGKPAIYPLGGLSTAPWSEGLVVGDFNHDGRLDAAVGDLAGVQIFLQRGGRFVRPRTVPVPFWVSALGAADLNRDGRMDLVVTGRVDGSSSLPVTEVLWNRSAGWRAQKIDAAYYLAIRFADINGDGRLDIVPTAYGSSATPSVRLYLNDGHGGFTTRTVQVATQGIDAPDAITAGDVTGDHRADLVFVNGWNSPRSHLAVMAGSASGTLAAATIYPSYDLPNAVAIADLNGDHRNDVVVLHDTFMKVGVYYQAAGGTLGTEQLLDVPHGAYGPNGVAVGAIDPGSRPDIAIADGGYTKALIVVRQP